MKLELNGERIKIRRLKFSDAKDAYENVRDKEIVAWTLNIPHPYPKDEAVNLKIIPVNAIVFTFVSIKARIEINNQHLPAGAPQASWEHLLNF